MRSNNLIEVTSQSYIAFFAILYSSTLRIHIPIETIAQGYPSASTNLPIS